MRRDHHVRPQRRLRAQRGQRASVQHHRLGVLFEHRAQERAGLGAGLQPGAEHAHVALAQRAEQRRLVRKPERPGAVEHVAHQLGRERLRGADLGLARGDRHQARARTKRRQRRQAQRPALARAAAHQEHVAKRALEARCRPLAQLSRQRGEVDGLQARPSAAHGVEQRDRHADLLHAQLADRLERPVGEQPGLERREGGRHVRLHAGARSHAGVGVHARGLVDRHHARAVGARPVHGGDGLGQLALGRAADAGAEQRVHQHQARAGLPAAEPHVDAHAQRLAGLRHGPRVALQLGEGDPGVHLHRHARAVEVARRAPAVAAVVALAAEHDHPRGPQRPHHARDRQARRLHQPDERQAQHVAVLRLEVAELLGGGEAHQRLIRAIMSRTAWSMPTSTARATIEWPMLSSSTSSMSTMGRTLS
jgi:hypothetical protein